MSHVKSNENKHGIYKENKIREKLFIQLSRHIQLTWMCTLNDRLYNYRFLPYSCKTDKYQIELHNYITNEWIFTLNVRLY